MKPLKFILLLILFNLIFDLGWCQTEKEIFLVGSNLFIKSSKDKRKDINKGVATEEKNLYFSINPRTSYFVLDGFSVGLVIPYTYRKFTGVRASTSSHDFSLGISSRYCFLIGRGALFPEVSYSSGMSKQDHEEEWNKSSNLNLGLGGTYFVTKSIGIEGIFYYNRYDLKSYNHSV